jgi:hypothetical protein
MDIALDLMWRKYRGWAKLASEIRADLDRWRVITLGLTVAGALLATLATQLLGRFADAGAIARVLSVASAASMALAAWSANTMIDTVRERNWIRARALAERAKSESYRYVTRVAPYEGDNSSQKLMDRLSELAADGQDLSTPTITDDEAGVGKPNAFLTAQAYVEVRIEQQVSGFFEPKAAANELYAVRFMRLVQLLSGCAAILAALGAYLPEAGIQGWVATLSTVSASVGAYALAKRFQRLAATYRLVADRLRMREAAEKSLIVDAESILNGENQSWAADFQTYNVARATPVSS